MNTHHIEISIEIETLRRHRELLDKQIKELEEEYNQKHKRKRKGHDMHMDISDH